jgi:cell division initiation protein
MELTPNEMRNHQFSSSFRGVNKAEVGAFKESAATTLEEARAQIQKLTEKNELLSAKYNELKNLEETIKSAMIEAQKNAEQITINARKEAELIVSEAKNRRDKAIDEKYEKISELEAKIQKLEFAKKSFYTKLRSEMEAHLKLVDSIMPPDKKYEPTNDNFQNESPSSTSETAGSSEPFAQAPPVEEIQPDETPMDPTPEPPSLDMPDDEIDRIVDQFAEESQEEEKVTDGQPQGNDF